MATRIDCAVSSLLCVEDSSVFDGNYYRDLVGEFEEDNFSHRNLRIHNQNRKFFVGDWLLLQADEGITSMIERECHHLPSSDYLKRLRSGDLDVDARIEAVDWIEKVNALFNFGPFCSYLSVNYLDRFLSAYELPKGKAWTIQLVAVACLSIAAKIEEIDVPLSLDLQVGNAKYVFEAKTIERMELLILNTLRWRMQAVTPLSYIDYFLNKFNDDEVDPPGVSIMRSVQLILNTIRGIDFLAFKPSEVAAAVAVFVVEETKTVDTEEAISVLIQNVDKEILVKCIELIKNLSIVNGTVKNSNGLVQVELLPQSPIGVLDVAYLSYKSDDTTVGSCANTSHSSPDTKRRKLNRPFEVSIEKGVE